MPRVVPSQVVELIDSMFPWAAHERQEYLPQTLGIRDAAKLAALVSIVEEVPSNLITLDAAHYTNLVCSVAAIKNALNLWPHQGGSYVFDRVPGLSDLNPVTLIRQALSLCPDEYPSPATAELTFVEEAELRTNLRTDISVANEALSNGQWKAATVLAGAALEALLLWALDKHPERSKAVEALLASNALAEKPNSDPKRWSLHDYI